MALTCGTSHVGLTVGDVERTVSFFEAVGFKRVGGVAEYPAVFLSDGAVMVTVWQAQTEAPVAFDRKSNVGLHHLALKVPSLEALDKALAAVKAVDGVRVEFEVQKVEGMPLTHFMCLEPCGCRIEFTHHPTA